jgi:hypothetical protein
MSKFNREYFDLRFRGLKRFAANFINSSAFAKTIFFIIMWAIALIPTWLSLLVFWLLAPVGFLQVFLTLALCVVIFGAPQIGLGIMAALLTFGLIVEDL